MELAQREVGVEGWNLHTLTNVGDLFHFLS